MKLLKCLINKTKSNKGFTIAEVIIAMVIIGIVSATSTQVITKARTLSTQTYYYSEARIICENAIECFKYSETEDQFYVSTFKYTSKLVKKNNKYLCETGVYLLVIEVEYSIDESKKDTFSATCYNNKNVKIFKCNYDRG